MSLKRYLSFFLLLFLFFLVPFLCSQEVNPKDIFVFLIDQSKSMQPDALFERVKTELENFVRKEVKIGDRIIISGFGNQVSYYYDDILTTIEDKERIYYKIQTLKCADDWTHMSAAFAHLGKRLSELQGTYPNSLKYVYIFTDGKNDPNPELREKPEYFSEVLEKSFSGKEVQTKNSFIYFITFGREIPDEVKKIAQESQDRVSIQTLPRKPDIAQPPSIIPLKILLKLEKEQFSLMRNEQRSIELPFKIEAITRDAKVKYSLDSGQGELTLTKGMENFNIPYTPDSSQVGNFRSEVSFKLFDSLGEISPDHFDFYYSVNELEPVKIAVKLQNNKFALVKGKTKKVDLKFGILSANRDAKVKFYIDGKEETVDVAKSDKTFELPISSFEDTEGSHKIVLRAEVIDQRGSLEPDQFEVIYSVRKPPINPLIILAGIVLILILAWIIYRAIPSFQGEIIFIEKGEEYKKRLSGKFCKPLNKIKRSSSVHPGIRVCPASGGKVKIKFPDKVKISKNGIDVPRSPVLLRSEDIIEYADIKIKYLHSGSKRRA